MSNELWCDLCKVQLSSIQLRDAHNDGKRHQKKKAERDAVTALAARSVFISGFNPKITVTNEEISEALSCFGKVEKVHFDITKGGYAIVEFDEQFSAHRAIFEDKVRIGNQKVRVRARKVDFDQCQPKQLKEQTIDVNMIIVQISLLPTFVQQVDVLFDLYCLSDAEITERASCAEILTDALGDYFSSAAYVRIFGSSITSTGIKDSDIDASLFFETPLTIARELQQVGDLARNKYTLLTCDMAAIRGRKICAEEYARLTAADRVRLLNKIMNDIRKRARAPVSGQYPILDARCPLVRFVFNRKHTMDLSVDNHLGYAKSSWLKGIVQCDSSQLIRRFLVAFRFWAHANDLLRTDETERSNFNAYILNMLCIIYLQLKNRLPPLQRSQRELFVDGWRVDFDISNIDLSFLSLKKLFKDFFAWFVQLKPKGMILCPHMGCTLSVDQFQRLYPDSNVQDVFKLAFLNIQDPLEWSHNVSMLVSEKHFFAMRNQMLRALSRMKKSDSFLAVLRELPDEPNPGPAFFDDSVPKIEIAVSEPEQCLKLLNPIFVDILGFLPSVKTFRKPPLFEFGLCRIYFTKRCMWEGRRAQRRQLMKESPALADDPITLEKNVTERLYDTAEDLYLSFKVYVEQKPDMNCMLRLVLLNGCHVDFANLVHFLQHFIPTISRHFLDGEKMEE